MDLVWRSPDPDEPGLEHLRLKRWTEAEGTVVGVAREQAYTLYSWLDLTAEGHPLRLRCGLADGRHLDITQT